MKILRTILILLAVCFLAACHDNDLGISKPGLPDPEEYISFATRAPSMDDNGWMLLPLPGQNPTTVNKDGKEYEVPQYVGIYGYYVNEDATQLVEHQSPTGVETTVFQNDVLEAYDEGTKYPGASDGNVSEDVIDKRKNDIFDNSEIDYKAGVGEKQSDGTVKYENGIIENEKGEVIYDPSEGNPPVITDPPYGTKIYRDGSVELVDGTKIGRDGTLARMITYFSPSPDATTEGTAGEQKSVEVQIKPNGEYSILSTDVPESFVQQDQSNGRTIFPDGTSLEIRPGQTDNDPRFVTISFTMRTADGADVPVDYNCTGRELVFNPGQQATFLNLGSIWDAMDREESGSQNPVKPRRLGKSVTRADANYDDADDKYFYGYNQQQWQSEDYTFYAYAPASRNAKFEVNDKVITGRFVWEKIPCVSTTDYVVAKEEIWRKNKNGTPDRSRVHFDDMQHLMSRVRLYFAVHPDFDRIRKVVVTQASLSFQEEGFKKVYTFENKRQVVTEDGKQVAKHDRANGSWNWVEDTRYVYNPKYNSAFYSTWREAPPSDMVCYETASSTEPMLGKQLFPLPNTGWGHDNIFTDFFIVPFKDNATSRMSLHVEYMIYDINEYDPLKPEDKQTVDGHEMRLFKKEHLLRECKRESTITFKTPMHFQSGASHALKIMINPDYIYVLSDHDEPADMIVD